ncbi:MAG: GAF domain-containing SpoIIE family protein phosphatase [Nitritalea sp.]
MNDLRRVNITKVSFFTAIIAWLILLFVDITRLFNNLNQLEGRTASEFTYILEVLFFIMVYLFYQKKIEEHEQKDFLELIWRGTWTGLVALGTSLAISLFYYLLGDSRLGNDPLLANFFYHVNFALMALFLVSCALLFKHLILYQRSKKTVKQWQVFEVAMLSSMFLSLLNKNSFDYTFLLGLVFLVVLGTSLALNLKWIPYLTFKEKLKALLFFFTIQLATAYLFIQLLNYSDSYFIEVNLTDNLFLIALFFFVFIYALISFLVTLFNLPTSSVFEQKLTEAMSFQRLSQSIKPGENEEQVLDILLDSCMSAAYVDGAWLELLTEQKVSTTSQRRFISKQEQIELETLIESTKPFNTFDWKADEKNALFNGRIAHSKFQSAVMMPLFVNGELIGRMFLVKEVKDGFNKEMLDILRTFVGQACISVENYRLLNEAIKNERYREELKIAQRVQRSLLPRTLHSDATFQISGFSEAANEVGGDYYETFPLSEAQYAIMMGDVSGKGTSAAFNMSQMKGVFHSLVLDHPEPEAFIKKANRALSKCLERNHFITAIYMLVDTQQKSIRYSRAGHCPILYYRHATAGADYLASEGMGLGILRNQGYERYVHLNELNWNSGDILVLFTDGIIEAKNEQQEEFGYKRLKEALNLHAEKSAQEIQESIKQDVYRFIGKQHYMDDDYTMLVLKFN